MKKRTLLLTLLSAIMVTAFSVPAITAAFAEDPAATTEKTKIVEIFNGNAENVVLEVSKDKDSGEPQGTISAVADGEDTVISMAPDGWASFNVALKNPVDMNKPGAQICFEIKATGSKTWADVRGITYVSWWNQPVKLASENLNCIDGYVVKKYDLSPTMTETQLAKFKGLSIATGSPFNVKRVWVEYPNPDYVEGGGTTTEGVYQLVTEPVASKQDTTTWQHLVTISSEYAVQKGDEIKINLNFGGEVPVSGKAISMWVGGNGITFNAETKENYIYSKNAEWKYTFNGSFSGDITFGMWDSPFSIESATLTIVKHEQEKPVTGYDIFTGITEVVEPALNSEKTAWTAAYKGSVNGKAVSDGTALAFGTLEDGTYYVSGTNANTATRATIAMTDISSALLFGGVLNFKAKLDFAGADGRYAKLRLYYECGQWGEASFVEVPLTDYVAGEWKDYSVALKTLNVECAPKTTFGSDAPSTWFDWTKFVGMGISVGSAGEGNNVASFADVKITDVAAKTIVGIEAENAKTEYNSGEAFERTGLIVNVVFDDNGKVEVKNYVCNPEIVVAGTDKVEISWTYNGKTYTTEVPVTVTSEYSSLVVKTQPTKAAYKAGEKFSADGMKVVAVKADNTEVEVGDYEYYKGMLAPGTTALELSYNGLKTKVSITVAQFENSLSMTNKAFDENGEPSYGWKAQVASAIYVSQATYDAASEDDKAKMCVTPRDDEKGYYISANFDSNNYATRVFEYQVADYRLGDLYEDESYNAMVAVTYRTTSAFDKPVNFGLANFMEWNLGYHNADISGYIVSDGEWHTMYFDIALSYGEIDGMLWAGISGDVDFNAIVGFAVQSQATGTLDIADVSVKWNGDANAAKAVDTTAPEFTYSGEMTITAKTGDAAPTFADQKARDKNDGYIDVTVEWQEGAVTNGKLNEGTYTVKVYAVDAAGNKTEPYNITVNVEKGETPPAPPVTPETPENSGCKGTVESLPIIITLGIFAAAFLLIKRKREN